MKDSDSQKLLDIIRSFPERKILVLGDLMLDRYLWGQVDRISPEAPVPVVEVQKESMKCTHRGLVGENKAHSRFLSIQEHQNQIQNWNFYATPYQ